MALPWLHLVMVILRIYSRRSSKCFIIISQINLFQSASVKSMICKEFYVKAPQSNFNKLRA